MERTWGFVFVEEDRLHLFHAARRSLTRQYGAGFSRADSKIKVGFLELIAKHGFTDMESLDLIGALIRDKESAVRAAALTAWTLLPIADSVKAEGAALMLKDVNEHVRSAAVTALINLKALQYAARIREMKRSDPSSKVRLNCEIFEIMVGR